MARLFLAVWLASFAVQTTDLLALAAPDTCTEETRGSANDPCRDGCARCMCCARVPVAIPSATPLFRADDVSRSVTQPPLDPSTSSTPRGILHVPRAR